MEHVTKSLFPPGFILMPYWNYRAFDSNNNIIEDTEKAKDFVALAVSVRQRGYQVLEAKKLDPNTAVAMKRLEKMKKKPKPPIANNADPTIRHRIKRRILSLFGIRNASR